MKRFLLLLSALLLFVTLVGCGSNRSNDSYTLAQFQNEMKQKNYDFQIKDAQPDILQGERKRMTLADKQTIDIYVFSSKEEMEKEASRLDSTGNVYTKDSMSTNIDWVSCPHFYKKGNLIVQYLGEDKSIQSDLKGILSGQFAGADANL